MHRDRIRIQPLAGPILYPLYDGPRQRWIQAAPDFMSPESHR